MSPLRSALLVFIAAVASSLGCGGKVADISRYEVTLWVQDHPDLPLRTVVDGCSNWRPEGVICGLTTDPAVADVQVVFNDEPCVENDDGTHTLAWAGSDRIIHLRGSCVSHDENGRINEHDVAAIIGHEVGHQLGIWNHVPETCSEKHQNHPEGGPVCGQALMNAFYDPSVTFVTAIDDLAFSLRDEEQTVAPADGESDARIAGPSCTLKRH